MLKLDTVVRARIDQKTKERAEAVLAAIGLTLSDAVRLMMIRIAQEGAMPFNPLVPNEETIEAIKEARAGKLIKVGSVEDLNADDTSDKEVQAGLQASVRRTVRQ
jgi:DNA-damage-inducible protein J